MISIVEFLVCNLLFYNVNVLALAYFVRAHFKEIKRYEEMRNY